MLFTPWVFLLSSIVAILLPVAAGAFDDVTAKPTCAYCGMDRGKFAHSRMVVDYSDGSSFGACSIHCAAVDMAVNIDKAPVRIRVGDFKSKQLIEAATAVWVIGGSKTGVMTRRAKWAFADGQAAEDFVRENGGMISDFEAAMEASYQDMYQDTRMIREKRSMMREKKAAHP
jgi:hypothetical protein